MPEEAQDRIKLVYWLKSLKDLIRILYVNPATPVFHYKGKENVYVAHTLGDYVFILKTKEPIPEDKEISFIGERKLNLVEVQEVQAMGLKQLSKEIEGKSKE